MAKFSVGREEDDSEGPSSPRPKKRRTTCYQSQRQQRENLTPDQQEEEEEVESECDEQGEEQDDEEEEGESEHAEEEEEEGEEECNEEESGCGFQSIGDRGSAGPSGDGSICVTLTDPDVLDCPICLEPLNSPVFQKVIGGGESISMKRKLQDWFLRVNGMHGSWLAGQLRLQSYFIGVFQWSSRAKINDVEKKCENGHIACSSCCIKLGNKCPSCSWPIGYNRCRAIEKVIESVKISCINIKYGCNESVSYNKIHDHEKMCVYGPCSCPLSGCNFIGSSKDLFHHFSINHLNSAKHFQYNCLFPLELGVGQRYLILQEQSDRMTFVLNHGVELLGNVVNVICIAPSSTQRGYAYDLISRKEDSSVRLQSFTESIPRWDEHLPLKMFLLVPSDFRGFSGKLKLELCIRPLDAPTPILTGNCVV
ncbi:hypothetical protein RHMOL_Rhmol10G0097300 [Rhododendron molle]|uniref:Uncharacterized protein n=1 Tax=Rhododendron molle TaxID=49168 RepID=A0ACC0M1R9_RHOML|nr:hypothetical protein RHMOL_Rhmol10G0097300 [Rhododendron molle]